VFYFIPRINVINRIRGFMTRSRANGEHPWWENSFTLISVILGLPIVGLATIGLLSLLGANATEFPPMLNAEFFLADLGVRILTLPIGFFIFRALLKKVATKDGNTQ
tara:strand:- start:1177 stop:1497 length:321 start_codon:yes stop_codon:yes gene_type:complete